MNDYQQTIKYPVTLSGIALNSGNVSSVKLSPALPDSGILFYLNNGKCYTTIESNSCSISDCVYSTNVTNGKAVIHTIEHLLSALHAHGIDNIKITVMGDDEIPILDGSAYYYYCLIESAGISHQSSYRNYIHPSKTMRVEDGNKWIEIKPYDGLIVNVTINFPHPLIEEQKFVFNMMQHDYYQEIARAKTFGFYDYIKQMQSCGFFKGGTPETAIILDDEKVLNPSSMRWFNEFVRHKTLDLIGDLYVGGAIKGYVTSYCSGHELNNKLMRKINEGCDKEVPEIPTKNPYREGDA